MNLVLFDVDGTLLDNSRSDDKCYERAFAREFGVTEINQDLARYAHSTDSCITRQILLDHFGREATDDELHRAREAYCRELRAAFAAGSGASVPMRGVGEAIARASLGGWAMALATGGWRVSALLKLEHARLPVTSLPGGFADDHISREGIVEIARGRAESMAGRAAERAVYVGDGVWDVKACRVLGLPFVGIAHGGRADRLRAAGAGTVLADFADAAAFLDALDRAAAPR
jgi:phosphoglycolate phosphatase-like HAD superfamily hydrolase